MRFVSYAQNQEDVLLWRALREVARGIYIDVGASDPVWDSVTKAFYDRGWSGVNIEPSAQAFAHLVAARPRDVNLNVAVSDHDGEITLYDVAGSGLSTSVRANADALASSGAAVKSVVTPCRTLAGILAPMHLPEIHFLKVDVEGAEEAALRGADFATLRPWIILVEATEPNTTISNHGAWEPIILAAGYRFAHFDGLNRYYVSQEKANLQAFFDRPVSMLDGFIRYTEYHAICEISRLQVERDAHESALAQLRMREREVNLLNQSLADAGVAHANALAQVHRLQARYEKASLLTPLRFAFYFASGLRLKVVARLRARIGAVLRHDAVRSWLLGSPWMRKVAKKILNHVPQFERRVRTLLGLAPAPARAQMTVRPARPETRASRLLADLRGERGQS
jgi:FkbM family methyltransferase